MQTTHLIVFTGDENRRDGGRRRVFAKQFAPTSSAENGSSDPMVGANATSIPTMRSLESRCARYWDKAPPTENPMHPTRSTETTFAARTPDRIRRAR